MGPDCDDTRAGGLRRIVRGRDAAEFLDQSRYRESVVTFRLVQPQDAGLCSGVGADSARTFRMASAAPGKQDHVFASQIEVTTGMRFAAAFDQFFIKRNSIFFMAILAIENRVSVASLPSNLSYDRDIGAYRVSVDNSV